MTQARFDDTFKGIAGTLPRRNEIITVQDEVVFTEIKRFAAIDPVEHVLEVARWRRIKFTQLAVLK